MAPVMNGPFAPCVHVPVNPSSCSGMTGAVTTKAANTHSFHHARNTDKASGKITMPARMIISACKVAPSRHENIASHAATEGGCRADAHFNQNTNPSYTKVQIYAP